MNPTNEIDKESFANPNSAIKGSLRYFGVRMDNVPGWELYDPEKLQTESLFLQDFHLLSRAIDSILNGAIYEKANVAGNDSDGPPNSKYYLVNDRARSIAEDPLRAMKTHDRTVYKSAVRELVLNLQSLADENMVAIENSKNFYQFDQLRARKEIKYRQALKAELDKAGNVLELPGTNP